jgi:small subunit ribosomal protein S27e
MKSFETKSKFIKVRCEKCKNEQIIFNKAATIVKCLVCGEILAEPKASIAKIKAGILEVLS